MTQTRSAGARPAATPAALASRALALLRDAADPRRAARARTFFKPHETVAVHGVTAGKVREIEKTLHAEVASGWGVADALRFCELMLEEGSHEAKSIGFHLLTRYAASFPENLLDTAESWLANNACDNWAAVDDLCPCVTTPLVRRYPRLIPRVRRWTRSPSLWLRRASAVTFVPTARRGERLDVAYGVATSLFDDDEDLIHKATGWLLREAGRTDMKRLEAFLRRHGPRIPRTTLRYAIERFPAPRRRALLNATRPR